MGKEDGGTHDEEAREGKWGAGKEEGLRSVNPLFMSPPFMCSEPKAAAGGGNPCTCWPLMKRWQPLQEALCPACLACTY